MKALLLSKRTLLVTVFSFASAGVAGAAVVDDLRVSQVEQEVRELQRYVQQQTRRIEALESAANRSRVSVVPPLDRPAIKIEPTAKPWLRSASWKKIHPGMAEADVIGVLGAPTTVRPSEKAGEQIIFYAMELDDDSFLSGHVVIVDHRVVEVHEPALK